MKTEHRKTLVTSMRDSLRILSSQITIEHKKNLADPAPDTTDMPVGSVLKCIKDTTGYKKGDLGFHYGGNHVVVGPRVGPQADMTCFALAKTVGDVSQASKALSDKRVASVLRNVVLSVHAAFPEYTYDYEKNEAIAE